MPYIDPKTIEQVREIDLHTYLRDNEPDELVKLTPSTYCTRAKSEESTLRTTNGVIKSVEDLSAGKGIDFLLFQEVDIDSHRTFRVDQADMIASARKGKSANCLCQ